MVENKSAFKIWQTALGEIQVLVSKPNFRTWFDKTTGISFQDNRFVIGVPNTFVAEYLEKNQRSLIEKTLIGLIQQNIEVGFSINGKYDKQTDAGNADEPQLVNRSGSSSLSQRYTFDTFVLGDCNRMAHAAAEGVAKNPGHTYNPLFIYGGVGLGKTHLLHAIGHSARANGVEVVCASSEQFTNDFVKSIRERKTEEFRDRYRNAGMLLVDDIQFICGKEQTEESFFHTFNELHNAGRQIVVTCDCLPRSVPVLEERLRSRFEWGLTTCLEPPDLNTRLKILQTKASRESVDITIDILKLIAERSQGNIRKLEGALNRVIAYARLLNIVPTMEMAVKAMADIADNRQDSGSIPAPSYILKLVADCYQTTVEALKSQKRDRQTTLARQIAMYLIRKHTDCSLEQVGREIGGREPISVSQASKKIASYIQTNIELQQRVLALEEKISSPATRSCFIVPPASPV